MTSTLKKNGYVECYLKNNMTRTFCSVKENLDAPLVISN